MRLISFVFAILTLAQGNALAGEKTAQIFIEVESEALSKAFKGESFTYEAPGAGLYEPEKVDFEFESITIGMAESFRFDAKMILHGVRTGMQVFGRTIEGPKIDKIEANGRGRLGLRIENGQIVPRLWISRLDFRTVPGLAEEPLRIALNRYAEAYTKNLIFPADLSEQIPEDIPMNLSPEVISIDTKDNVMTIGVFISDDVQPLTDAMPERDVCLLVKESFVDSSVPLWIGDLRENFAIDSLELDPIAGENPESARVRVAGTIGDYASMNAALDLALAEGVLTLVDLEVERLETFSESVPFERVGNEVSTAFGAASFRSWQIPPVALPFDLFEVKGEVQFSNYTLRTVDGAFVFGADFKALIEGEEIPFRVVTKNE
ncbi:MAG: hypothetical protein NUW37_00575 [Planctomycetes bacterium]|nr:hypothetical protein [Planctomycetota bacterium]